MTTKDYFLYKKLIFSVLYKISNLNTWRRSFLLEIFTQFLSIKGRINFLQLARHGKYSELRYRQQFEKRFDVLEFNKTLVSEHNRLSIAWLMDTLRPSWSARESCDRSPTGSWPMPGLPKRHSSIPLGSWIGSDQSLSRGCPLEVSLPRATEKGAGQTQKRSQKHRGGK